jgi:RHS repeat-associated protein
VLFARHPFLLAPQSGNGTSNSVEGAGTKWYVTDRLGNVLGLVNSQAVMSGGQVATYSYGITSLNINIPLVAGSWLKVLMYSGPTAERRWAPPPTGDGLAFYDELEGGGRPWDPVAQMQYNRARWYSPMLGQFTTKDTYGYAAGDSNLYRYVGNSWPNATDPSGHDEVQVNPVGGLEFVSQTQGQDGQLIENRMHLWFARRAKWNWRRADGDSEQRQREQSILARRFSRGVRSPIRQPGRVQWHDRGTADVGDPGHRQ